MHWWCLVLLQVWGAVPSEAISPTTWSESTSNEVTTNNTVARIINLTCYEELMDQQNMMIENMIAKMFDKLTCNDAETASLKLLRINNLVSLLLNFNTILFRF